MNNEEEVCFKATRGGAAQLAMEMGVSLATETGFSFLGTVPSARPATTQISSSILTQLLLLMRPYAPSSGECKKRLGSTFILPLPLPHPASQPSRDGLLQCLYERIFRGVIALGIYTERLHIHQ